MMDVRERQAFLMRLGLDTDVEEREGKEVFVRMSDLPLTDAEWVSLCHVEGEAYVGGCCANLSAVQDRLNYWFRFRGAMPREVVDVFQALCDHHDVVIDEMTAEEAVEWYRRKEKPSPWDKLDIMGKLMQGHVATGILKEPTEKDPFKQAVHVASRTLSALSWKHLFGGDRQDEFSPGDRVRALRAAGPLRAILDRLSSLIPVDGWALVHPDAGPDVHPVSAIIWFGGDLLVFETEEALNEYMAKHQLEDLVKVRRVKASAAEGVRWAD